MTTGRINQIATRFDLAFPSHRRESWDVQCISGFSPQFSPSGKRGAMLSARSFTTLNPVAKEGIREVGRFKTKPRQTNRAPRIPLFRSNAPSACTTACDPGVRLAFIVGTTPAIFFQLPVASQKYTQTHTETQTFLRKRQPDKPTHNTHFTHTTGESVLSRDHLPTYIDSVPAPFPHQARPLWFGSAGLIWPKKILHQKVTGPCHKNPLLVK